MRYLCFAMLSLGAMLAGIASGQGGPVEMTIDAGRVIRDDAKRWIGINLNYIRDNDANRVAGARPLADALKEMGCRWLRYPGGEKSDFHLSAQPPYDKAAPRGLGWYAKAPGKRMDFDAYIAICRATGAQPLVVVGCDNVARTGMAWDQWLDHAVAWVKYANKTRGYNVKYWEIGNENWCNNTATAAEMGKIVVRFAAAMKAVDGSIQVGASGSNDKWWAEFLPVAAPSIDFLTVSNYIGWGWKSYDYYPKHPSANLLGTARTALDAIDRHVPPADRKRLRVIVTETNSKDYTKDGWPADNTLGHAIVTFDIFGKLLQEPRVISASLWTTRWMNDAEANTSQWYGVGPKNELKPAGQAVAAWGKYLHEHLVAVTGGSQQVYGYASVSGDRRAMSVWIVNRGYEAARVRLNLKNAGGYRKVTVRQLTGRNADDTDPRWSELPGMRLGAEIGVAGVSITVLNLE